MHSISRGLTNVFHINTNNSFLPTNIRKMSNPNMEYKKISILGTMLVGLLFLLLLFYKLGFLSKYNDNKNGIKSLIIKCK